MIKIILTLFLVLFVRPILATELPHAVVITTGGTIASQEDPHQGGSVPVVPGEALIKAVPEIKQIADIQVIPIDNIDSRNISPERWIKLAKLVNQKLQEPKVEGIVITHGTDTMEDTTFFLDLTLKSGKPVILTGAMRPASDVYPDGPTNILNAIRAIISHPPQNMGAMIAMEGKVFSARYARKIHTNDVDAFDADIDGQIGEIDKQRVTWWYQPLRRQILPLPKKLPKVDIIKAYPGAQGETIQTAIQHKFDGIVVVGYGIGNVSNTLYTAIKQARQKGIIVVITTRVKNGRIYPAYGGEGGGKSLQDIGVVLGNDLRPEKARILLMLALTLTQDPIQLQRFFDV